MALRNLVLGAGVVLGTAACTTRLGDLTILSTKNVELNQIGGFERHTVRVEGKDAAPILLFVPAGTPNMEEAVDRAIESVPGGVALVNAVAYAGWWWIPLVYGQEWFRVEGTVLVDPRVRAGR